MKAALAKESCLFDVMARHNSVLAAGLIRQARAPRAASRRRRCRRSSPGAATVSSALSGYLCQWGGLERLDERREEEEKAFADADASALRQPRALGSSDRVHPGQHWFGTALELEPLSKSCWPSWRSCGRPRKQPAAAGQPAEVPAPVLKSSSCGRGPHRGRRVTFPSGRRLVSMSRRAPRTPGTSRTSRRPSAESQCLLMEGLEWLDLGRPCRRSLSADCIGEREAVPTGCGNSMLQAFQSEAESTRLPSDSGPPGGSDASAGSSAQPAPPARAGTLLLPSSVIKLKESPSGGRKATILTVDHLQATYKVRMLDGHTRVVDAKDVQPLADESS
mmetsp:Transcript_87748/g.248611  ORF Transcript_87748/g.248611 Transcript_87748/m.248611 type:complete len:334 (-) Transcript_87748:72-1073(-)